MRKRGWLVPATVAGAGALAAAALLWRVSARQPESSLGPLRVTPPVGRISVRVGDAVRFTAGAEGASRIAWSVWGRETSVDPDWSYVPGPEDAGWQQIRLVVSAPDATRVERTWDVGVIPAVPPELVEVTPPPGTVPFAADASRTFRIAARVPAARAKDRLRFQWTMDDRVLRRDEHDAARGSSEMSVGTLPAGRHRLAVRVTEDERIAALAEWTLEVAAPPLPLPPALETPPPTAPATPEPPAPGPEVVPPVPAEAAVPPPLQLVTAPRTRRLTAEIDVPVAFSAYVEPAPSTAVAYRWSVDGRARSAASHGEFSYEPDSPGAHRVAVTVLAGGQTVATDTWVVDVRPRAEPEAAAPVVAPAPPPAPPATTVAAVAPAPPPPAHGGLAEADVRRWLDEYARAWSRKDADALQRMGQVRTPDEAQRLRRYFESINALRVDVRVLALRVEGNRASVEFERMDTVTDPSGRQQQLRLPAMRKEIERTPDGLRFTSGDARG